LNISCLGCKTGVEKLPEVVFTQKIQAAAMLLQCCCNSKICVFASQ